FRMNINAKKISLIHGDWKYIYNEQGEDEFYNLSIDPLERENIINEEREMAEKCLEKIKEHLKEITYKGKEIVNIKRAIKKLKYREGGI
ncbi:MAG: hypothetical protein ACTSVC_16660, partial [Promethearchaeota archaeon]